jgi:lipoyl(octanoyl) transferase
LNPTLNKQIRFIDLGLIDYQQAWDYQTDLFNKTVELKKQNRDLSASDPAYLTTTNYLIFCEHPHVYTLGKSGDEKNLLIKKEELHTIQASYFPINRGGDITYHGPGQLVVYPVIDMENFFTDIHRYMRLLEEAVIQTLSEFKMVSGRINGLTGVWIDHEKEYAARKICAMGVKTSRWVTMHGLALNVNSDLSYFNHIVPCGIDNKAVTSIEKELGTPVEMTLVKSKLKEKIFSLFGMTLAR